MSNTFNVISEKLPAKIKRVYNTENMNKNKEELECHFNTRGISKLRTYARYKLKIRKIEGRNLHKRVNPSVLTAIRLASGASAPNDHCFIKQEFDVLDQTEDICYEKTAIKQELLEEELYYENTIELHTANILSSDVWICELCDTKFSTELAYTDHKKLHQKVQNYCDICGLVYITKMRLGQHMASHENENTHKLKEVNYLQQDIKNDGSRNFTCRDNNTKNSFSYGICKKWFSSDALVEHISNDSMNEVSVRRVQCIKCKVPVKFNQLSRHNCFFNVTFRCDHCSAMFFTKTALVKHRSVHFQEESRELKLNNVNAVDNAHINLTEKDKKHSDKVYQDKGADICLAKDDNIRSHSDKQFNLNASKRLEDEFSENPFTIEVRFFDCHLCPKRYRNHCTLRNHIKDIHGPKTIRMCEICNKSYATKKGYLEHKLNVHPKEKKHICQVCNKAFVAPHLVLRHMLKHTGVKNYQCEYCGKCFQMPHTLKLHRKLHKDDKLFQCYNCDKKFITKGALRNHVKTHMIRSYA